MAAWIIRGYPYVFRTVDPTENNTFSVSTVWINITADSAFLGTRSAEGVMEWQSVTADILLSRVIDSDKFMLKETYDKDLDGVVDEAESVDGGVFQ